MFKMQNKVRMHDTDMAGILYFPKQFRFVHEALEDFTESEGFNFHDIFHGHDFVFVVVHAEADYLTALRVGDELEVHVGVERIGNSSFVMDYAIYRLSDQLLVGKAKTIHCCLSAKKREKIIIPDKFRTMLEKHLIKNL